MRRRLALRILTGALEGVVGVVVASWLLALLGVTKPLLNLGALWAWFAGLF